MHTESKQKKPVDKKKIIYISTASVLILVLVISCGWFSRAVMLQRDSLQSQLETSQAKTAALEKQMSVLTTTLEDSNAQIKKFKDDIEKQSSKTEAPKAPELELKITGVTKDSRGYGYSGNYTLQMIFVDVSLTNKSTENAYVALSDFELKDGKNVRYRADAGANWPPAANKTELKSQTVGPGETLSGSFSFGNVPVTFTNFVLYYKGNANNVTAKDATYGWYTYPWCAGKEGTGELGC